jgi:DNA-binding LytR/AlgR family response regulator
LLLLPDSARSLSQPLAAAGDEFRPNAGYEMLAMHSVVPVAGDTGADNPEFGRGTYSPLGGAGAPPRRFARHLPIERDGGTHFLAVEQVVAVHANAHYTYVFDGNDKLFCPLAIGDVESRLDNSHFVRVHRSHIVNIDRVVGYKRSGDNELVEMAAPHHYLVPVSRSRIGSLKSRVATLNGADPAFAPRRRHFASQ